METNGLFSLNNKIAIVTGGAGHLGCSVSEVLAEYGCIVFMVSRHISEDNTKVVLLRQRFKEQIQTARMDIRSTESIRKMYEKILTEYGKIDILVNNAYFGVPGSLEEMTEENWNKGIEGSINSVFRCTKEIVPTMKKLLSGSIINMASMYGIVSPNPEIYRDSGFDNPPNYGAGKAAIIQFTRYAACHLAKYGIRVNAVSPGPFPNEEVQKNEEFIANLKKKVPMKRFGQPGEIKGVIALLASDASSFITGANISVDGGWTAW
jgi:NAD(P)-dependent dehydrogenase (short-subunit alcohol dehydrogenase family)